MAEPRIFISSTYEDLREVRNGLHNFIIGTYGYKPVSFEKNGITYEPHKSLEESCYDEIKDCSMFILLIKSRFGAPANINKIKGVSFSQEIKSITQLEYLTAKQIGIPVFVFIHKSSSDEYNSWKKQFFFIDYKFNYLENINHARFVKDIFDDESNLWHYDFITIENITDTLKNQWAGLFNRYLKNSQKHKIIENQEIYINPFKFFFFRRKCGLSKKALSERAGVSENKIDLIENAGLKKSRVEIIEDFEKIKVSDAEKLSEELNCNIGNIKAGLPDDFLTQYLSYYMRNKGVQHRFKKDKKAFSLFKTRAIIFDFDGTLTSSRMGYTTWEEIWVSLGYNIEECGRLHKRFSRTEITHKEWCQITENKFKTKGLSKSILNNIAENIVLLPNIYEVLKELSDKGINLSICSGSIDYVIKKVLGDKIYNLFDKVQANKFRFNNDKLVKIIGTRYDFQGKADFVNQVALDNEIEPYEILFIGNSLNDEWAHESGALTLCINPKLTNPDHPYQWTYSIREVTDFKQILEFVNFGNEIESEENQLNRITLKKRFKIALSFPGEYRDDIVKPIADKLSAYFGEEKILYDHFHKSEFARPNLDIYLQKLYHNESELIVVCLCEQYNNKKWCGLEWRAIRNLLNNHEDNRIMFLRVDRGKVDGIFGTIDGYIDVSKDNIDEVKRCIIERYDQL